MEKSVRSVPGNEPLDGGRGIRIFGIRHLSPAGAYHLLAYLDEVKPTAVLVEGPNDAGDFIDQLASRGVVPPVAILAYTDKLPVRTLLYPYAEYSPEYQAFQWASRNRASAAFIDLPSDISLALYEQRSRNALAGRDETPEREQAEAMRHTYVMNQRELYEQIAELAGEPDYETFWERQFEHNSRQGTYRLAVSRFSAEMRELTDNDERQLAPEEAAYNEIREAYMRRQIRKAIERGHAPDKIVVVTGAHHASALNLQLPAMSDKQLKGLPKATTRLTLMPYSNYKLSSRSGYGAGNQAPAYFGLMWDCIRQGELHKLPSLYLSQLAARLRESGTYRSTASVIEAVRLAEALASMHGGSQPAWKDLRDAAVVCLGFGELSVIAEALARTDIGTAIGSLPEGVSQTPVQDDLNRELKRLKLEKYKSSVAATLELDLRENRRVKSEEAAFLDLRRSVLLHRLELLGIQFAAKQRVNQDSASWAERWVLRWTPEVEIQTVESTLKGETVELAAAFVLKEQLDACTEIVEASRIVRTACNCELTALMEHARSVLQQLAVDTGSFEQVAAAAYELSVVIRFGSVRRFDTEPLVSLLERLFLRGTLLLLDASSCNNDAAPDMAKAIQTMHTIAQEHYGAVDESLWLAQLEQLASRDDRNALLSGFAFAILLEKNDMPDEHVAKEVSRRLSPGIPADLGAGWFEGLSMRNRYALLSRASLWQQLDAYIGSLDREQFIRALVFLRRAFGTFEPREKAAVAELMGELWGVGAVRAGAAIQRPLSDEEKEQLNSLNEFDFGDI